MELAGDSRGDDADGLVVGRVVGEGGYLVEASGAGNFDEPTIGGGPIDPETRPSTRHRNAVDRESSLASTRTGTITRVRRIGVRTLRCTTRRR